MTQQQKYQLYLQTLRTDFTKVAKLEFLAPDGSVTFALDNNPLNRRSGAFIQDGSINVNLQNGQRRKATVVLSNLQNEYDFNVNNIWFGQQIRLQEGLILPTGEPYYIPQGVFYMADPEEVLRPREKTASFTLYDKWAYLDGTLFGNLDGIYEVPLNTNIFNAIRTILALDRGNGIPIDNVPPLFTEYYNGKTVELPSKETVPVTNTPYTYRTDEDGTYSNVVEEMNTMLAGWIGYDTTGRLRLEPSQDDILDNDKPILWDFTPTEKEFLGATYAVKSSEVYNDIIIMGEALEDAAQAKGRATNQDPRSDTNIFGALGKRTLIKSSSGYYADKQCEDLAAWWLKRYAVLTKSVSISSSQMFHIVENNLVTIRRLDKKGTPVERHLVTGFSRPLGQRGEMTIQATSVEDFPIATITKLPGEEE